MNSRWVSGQCSRVIECLVNVPMWSSVWSMFPCDRVSGQCSHVIFITFTHYILEVVINQKATRCLNLHSTTHILIDIVPHEHSFCCIRDFWPSHELNHNLLKKDFFTRQLKPIVVIIHTYLFMSLILDKHVRIQVQTARVWHSLTQTRQQLKHLAHLSPK